MKKYNCRLVMVVVLLLVSVTGVAFEMQTHALIMRQAFENSTLNQTGTGSVLNRLGLDRLEVPRPFDLYWQQIQSGAPHEAYFDEQSNGTFTLRYPGAYERCLMQQFLNDESLYKDLFQNTVEASGASDLLLPIQNWLLRGAIREDDLPALVTAYTAFGNECGVYQYLDDLDPYGNILRVGHHFYDPRQDKGLDPCPVNGFNGWVTGLTDCKRSVDWVLGFIYSFSPTPLVDSNRRNHFSYADARENLWRALTQQTRTPGLPYTNDQRAADAEIRLYRWATAFRALGDVGHILADTAQPQHGRNDAHSNLESGQQQAFEALINARALGNKADALGSLGAGGTYARSFFGEKLDKVLPPLELGSYPAVMFGTPQRFFSTRNAGEGLAVSPMNRYGLADYANRGFFTGGTLPGSADNPYDQPPQEIDLLNGYTIAVTPCEALLDADPRLNATSCVHYLHAVPDVVNPSYAQTSDVLPTGYTLPDVPLLSDSIFREVIATAGLATQFLKNTTVLSTTELNTIGNLTVPRAVGYTTGLLNYFFRGELTIEMPPAGLYAIVDHAGQHSLDADGYPVKPNGDIFGFTQVQIKVKNTTPTIVESGTNVSIPQTAKSGQLVLVAQFHRYHCYKPDLSGQPSVDLNTGVVVPAVCATNDPRSEYPEIAVSAPLSVDANGQVTSNGVTFNLNGQSSGLAQFDFSADPIPINATDLFLQVVYRGKLGDEQDGIAVGRIDVSEPTYNMNANLSDMFVYQNQWFTQGQVTQMMADQTLPMGIEYQPSNLIFYQQCIDGKLVAKTGNGQAANQGIPPASIVRYAGIFDLTQQHTISIKGQYWKVITNSPGNLQSGSEANGILPYLAQAAKAKDPGVDTDEYPPNPYRLGYGRGVRLGSRLDSFHKAYQANYAALPWMPSTNFTMGPNGFLPVAMDQVYLTSQACP